MNLKLVIALVALTLPLAACGNKGRLVMAPAPSIDMPVVETPPTTEPAEPGPPAEIPPPEAAEPASTAPPPMPAPPDDEDGDG